MLKSAETIEDPYKTSFKSGNLELAIQNETETSTLKSDFHSRILPVVGEISVNGNQKNNRSPNFAPDERNRRLR